MPGFGKTLQQIAKILNLLSQNNAKEKQKPATVAKKEPPAVAVIVIYINSF